MLSPRESGLNTLIKNAIINLIPMKTVIVYYSLSGNTKKLGDLLAAKLSADKTRIEEKHKNDSLLTMLRLIFQVLLNKPSQISPLELEPSQYDLVILGTPVWMERLSSPMRALISQEKSNLKNVAFFCTEDSAGGSAVFEVMSKLCGKKPIATLEITQNDINNLDNNQKLSDFINACQSEVGDSEF